MEDLFIALSGPNFDGHDFIDAAFNAGAVAALVEKANTLNGRPGLVVQDTMLAMRDLGINARERCTAQIAAITGSVERSALKRLWPMYYPPRVIRAPANGLNNHWGVPLSVARLPNSAKYGVFEIGMSHPGEITPLARLVRPHVAVNTAIAPAHREFFDFG